MATVLSNSSHLIVRTVVTMVASVVAVRWTVAALGVEGYGTYAAVLAVVAVFRMFNGALEDTAQRFVGTEVGREDGNVQDAFSALLTLSLCFVAVVVLIAETGGLWFVFRCLSMPAVARGDLMVVYQSGVFATVLMILQVPFWARIIVSERMAFFSKVGWVEAAVALAAALAARAGLAAYALALAGGTGVVFALFVAQCRRQCPSLRFRLQMPGRALFEQERFFLWGMLSGVGNAVKYQGVSLLLNLRAGVAFNASWNVSLRIRDFLLPFGMNVLQAIAPRVYKSWGRGNVQIFSAMIGRSLLVVFIGVLAPSVLAFVFAPELIRLWLAGEAPPQIVVFLRCSLIGMVADAFSRQLTTAINASGRVALYQAVASGLSVAGFALAWLFLAAGFPPWSAMLAVSAVNAVACAYRYYHVRVLMGVRPTLSLRAARRSS